jgi:hypothetical protein
MRVKAIEQFVADGYTMYIGEEKELDDAVARGFIADGLVEEVYGETVTEGDWELNKVTGLEERTVTIVQTRVPEEES